MNELFINNSFNNNIIIDENFTFRLKSQVQELQQEQVKMNQTLNSQSYLNTMLKEKVTLFIIIHIF